MVSSIIQVTSVNTPSSTQPVTFCTVQRTWCYMGTAKEKPRASCSCVCTAMVSIGTACSWFIPSRWIHLTCTDCKTVRQEYKQWLSRRLTTGSCNGENDETDELWVVTKCWSTTQEQLGPVSASACMGGEQKLLLCYSIADSTHASN